MSADIYVTAQKILTTEETDRFLATFLRNNPGWQGAQVADILDALDNADEHLEVIEPLYELMHHEIKVPKALAVAGYLIIHLDETFTFEDISKDRVREFANKIADSVEQSNKATT